MLRLFCICRVAYFDLSLCSCVLQYCVIPQVVIHVSKSPEHHKNHHLHYNLRFSLQPSGFFAVYDVIFVIKLQDTIESIWQHSTMFVHDDYGDYYDEELFILFCLFFAFGIQLIWKRKWWTSLIERSISIDFLYCREDCIFRHPICSIHTLLEQKVRRIGSKKFRSSYSLS